MYFIIKYTKINSILNNLQVYQIFLNMNPLFKKNGWMNEEILLIFNKKQQSRQPGMIFYVKYKINTVQLLVKMKIILKELYYPKGYFYGIVRLFGNASMVKYIL